MVHCSFLLKKLALRPTSLQLSFADVADWDDVRRDDVDRAVEHRLDFASWRTARKPKGSCCERLTLQDFPESVPRIQRAGG